MAVFTEHVVLRNDLDIVTFRPGDVVPEWALGQVGDHCIKASPSDLQAEADAESEGMPSRGAADDAGDDAGDGDGDGDAGAAGDAGDDAGDGDGDGDAGAAGDAGDAGGLSFTGATDEPKAKPAGRTRGTGRKPKA